MRPTRLFPALAIAAVIVVGAAFATIAAPTMRLGAFAVAATKSSPSPNARAAKAQQYCDSFVADLAKKLGTSPSNLRTQVKATIDDQVDQAVKNGGLTQSQADAIKKRVDAAQGCRALPSLGGFMGRAGSRIESLKGVVGAAATALNVTPAALQADVMSGKTLQQVAPANMTQAQFDAAFKAALAKTLDPQVTANQITSQQETDEINEAIKVADRLWSTPIPQMGGFGGRRGFFGRLAPGAGPGTAPTTQ